MSHCRNQHGLGSLLLTPYHDLHHKDGHLCYKPWNGHHIMLAGKIFPMQGLCDGIVGHAYSMSGSIMAHPVVECLVGPLKILFNIYEIQLYVE